MKKKNNKKNNSKTTKELDGHKGMIILWKKKKKLQPLSSRKYKMLLKIQDHKKLNKSQEI